MVRGSRFTLLMLNSLQKQQLSREISVHHYMCILGLCAGPDCPLLTKAHPLTHNTEFADWVWSGAQLAPLSQF